MAEITIRSAVSKEIEWINKTYASINFVSSNFDQEYIAIAEIEGTKCGLGRLVTIDDHHTELGGMYVFKEYRGLGIAEKIVQHLMENATKNKKIWCLPFAHLQNFYVRFGFIDHKKEDVKIPDAILSKQQWCVQNYTTNTLLLVK